MVTRSLVSVADDDEPGRPRLLDQGAVECLFKPFGETALPAALNTALRVDQRRYQSVTARN